MPDVFGTCPRRKKNLPTVPSKPASLISTKRSHGSNNTTSNTQLSPLLHRVSRSHSFDNILDIVSPDESPKISRQMILGSMIRPNTNASNNSKANSSSLGEDSGDNYIELERRADIPAIETFTALENYVAQSDICLSFNAGNCCALLKKTKQNWWLVNIGGKEGWVPGSFWESSSQVSVTVATKSTKIIPSNNINYVSK